jgi:hypothetical protein
MSSGTLSCQGCVPHHVRVIVRHDDADTRTRDAQRTTAVHRIALAESGSSIVLFCVCVYLLYAWVVNSLGTWRMYTFLFLPRGHLKINVHVLLAYGRVKLNRRLKPEPATSN